MCFLAGQASEQGLDITVDSNAKHRARITRFGHLRQQSKDMSNWLFTQHDEARSLDTPMANSWQHALGILPIYYQAALIFFCLNTITP